MRKSKKITKLKSTEIDPYVGIMLENIEYWREAPVWKPASIAEATKEWFEYLSPGRDGSASEEHHEA